MLDNTICLTSEYCSKIKAIQNLQQCCQHFRCYFKTQITQHTVSLYLANWSILLGCFYLTKNFSLHFRKFPPANETAFSTISGKKEHLCRLCPNFQTFLTRNECWILLSSWNFKNFWLNGSHFGNLPIFRFAGNFPRKFPYYLPPF